MTLTVDNLDVRYGGVHAVRGLSLAVASGEIVGLIGPNGAGKSSTLHAIMGLAPASGSVRLDDRELIGRRPEDVARIRGKRIHEVLPLPATPAAEEAEPLAEPAAVEEAPLVEAPAVEEAPPPEPVAEAEPEPDAPAEEASAEPEAPAEPAAESKPKRRTLRRKKDDS